MKLTSLTQLTFSLLILVTPAIADDIAEKPLFVGQWTIYGADVTCGKWPRNIAISSADTQHIVVAGTDYPVTGLPGHPPHDRENVAITPNIDFQITGEVQKLLIMSFKKDGKVTGQCAYVKIASGAGN